MSGKNESTSKSSVSVGVFDHTPQTLRELMVSWGYPPFRAKQILGWVYSHGAATYDEMTNLPQDLRWRLTSQLPLYESTITRRRNSSDATTKLLLTWPDGATSECVLIPDGSRRTACISTQVGCPVGCVFCASGLGGLTRNLSVGQIVEQAMRASGIGDRYERLSNVVFMGVGEPLANYDSTVRALRTINADWGLGIGARKITVSTVGLPERMRSLAKEGLQITLALSLHAATDELRGRIIPWAGRATIEELVEAASYYFEHTGREITLEYVLLAGMNDSKSCARQLATMSKRMRSNVNLIRYNPVRGLPYKSPDDSAVDNFAETLRSSGVNVHVRRSRGLEIDAACGQLRREGHAG